MGIIADKLKKEVRIKAYNIARKAYLKKSICNIGRIVEEDDKIICYVDQKSLDKYKGNYPIYKLMLHGMNQVTHGIKETIENFGLNKPVYYIFDGIEFKNALEFSFSWANVIFRNCTFNKNIGIIWGEEILFENNKYSDHCSCYFYGDCFLSVDRIKKITFINEQFINSYELKRYGNPTQFGMKIDSQIVEFINSKIDAEYPATIKIKSKETKIENSVLSANEIYVDSESIEFTDSSITAQNGVMIENANCDFIGNIDAPIVFYNGADLASKNNKSNKVAQEEKKLKTLRLLLVGKLQIINNSCKEKNDKKIRSMQENLDKQPIGKILIRK